MIKTDVFQLELQCLRDENKHLKALLNQHQITWKETAQAKPLSTPAAGKVAGGTGSRLT